MSVLYPGLDSAEFESDFKIILQDTRTLESLFDSLNISAGAAQSTSDVQSAETLIAEWNSFNERLDTIESYIYAFISTDSQDATAQRRLNELVPIQARLRKLGVRMTAWLGERNFGAAANTNPVLVDHARTLEIAKVMSTRLMSPAEEDLAADLASSGSGGWERLQEDYSSLLRVEIHGKGTFTMPQTRGMAYDADQETRRAAYEGELATWKQAETVIAFAMNGIKGEVGQLSKRRGWNTPLDRALFSNGVSRESLDAMLDAAKATFPSLRKYMRIKGRLLGSQSGLPWFDLFAPIAKDDTEWSFAEGAAFVIEQFGKYSAKMGDFAARAVRERWIDAAPRPNKRDGAFCMPLRRDESRLLQTWKPSFSAVSTLAHELGHGYHNLCLSERTNLQRNTPMTLAETASIFCETIIMKQAVAQANESQKLALLESNLQRSTQTVVDITSRFLFEQSVFEKRAERDLSASELCELMESAQEATYGDGLSEARHPYMWAAKPHYYSGSASYYNYPYMFGQLFSMGLYTQYEDDPERFRSTYDDLLSATGMFDAETLARRFNIDIRSGEFWDGSLRIIREEVEQFAKLVEK